MLTMTKKSRDTLPVSKSNLNCCLIAVTVVLLGLSSVYADTVYVDPSYFDGSRSSGLNGGITATGDWDNGGFELSWEIEYEDGVYEYEYEITSPLDEEFIEVLNHWVLQLMPIDADWTGVFGDSTEVGLFTPDSSWGVSGDLFGVKFEDGTLEVSFESPYAPVWGSFYATDGDGLYAYNTDFELGMPTADTADFTNWIVTDGAYSVPEPSTLILLLSGTGLLAGAARFRKKI